MFLFFCKNYYRFIHSFKRKSYRERKDGVRSSILWFTPQMYATAWDEPLESQKSGCSWVSHMGTEVQALKPCSTTFPGRSLGNWFGGRAAGLSPNPTSVVSDLLDCNLIGVFLFLPPLGLCQFVFCFCSRFSDTPYHCFMNFLVFHIYTYIFGNLWVMYSNNLA